VTPQKVPPPRKVVVKTTVTAGCATKTSSLKAQVTALRAQVKKLKKDHVAQQKAHKAKLAKVTKKESSQENTGRAIGLTLGLYGATFSGQAAKGFFGVSASFISELTTGGKVPLFFSAEGGFTFSAAVNAQKDEGHAWFLATGLVIGNINLGSSMATLHGQVGYLYHNDGISQKGKLVHGDLGGVYAGGKLFLKSRLMGKIALAFDLKGFVVQHTLRGKSETVFGVMAGFSLAIIP
jgi:outer membrane murein-binding lipoprotein Lpp